MNGLLQSVSTVVTKKEELQMMHEFLIKVPSQLQKQNENIQGFEVEKVKYYFSHHNLELAEKVYGLLKLHDENIQDIKIGASHDGFVIEAVNKYKEKIQTVLHVKWRLLLESRFIEVIGNIQVPVHQIELVCKPLMTTTYKEVQENFEELGGY